MEQWLACLAHNQEVVGSNPTPATNNKRPLNRGSFVISMETGFEEISKSECLHSWIFRGSEKYD